MLVLSFNSNQRETRSTRNDLNSVSHRWQPTDQPQCLVHAEHQILIFLYFKFDARIGLPDSCSKFLRKFRSRLRGSRSTGDSDRQQMPYLCHSRNHGLWANVSSCLRFAAEMSLALSGLMSGASNISCSCSMSSMMRSTSIPVSISNISTAKVKRDGTNNVSVKASARSSRAADQRTG